MHGEWLLEVTGDPLFSLLTGLSVGLAFGIFAQRSKFCMRSAAIEFWRGVFGSNFSIWLIVFSSTLIGTQLMIFGGMLDEATIRQLTTTGTISGAIIGGAIFGAGMILARGCASRLLVLSATGNLRALVAGLVVTIAAQASLTGVFSSSRQYLSSLWMIPAESRNLSNFTGEYFGFALGTMILIFGIFLARNVRLKIVNVVLALGVGGAIVGGWALTAWHSKLSYALVPVKSISFTGPSANTLMGLISQPTIPLNFDTGLVPGVFIGSLLAAVLSGSFQIQRFDADTGLVRYLIGAGLMGFGGMLAGGCAVGAGVTGGSVMALTAWIALSSMWASAGLMIMIIDHQFFTRLFPKVL